MKRKKGRPIIGILANILTVEGGPFPGQERSYINQEYVTAIMQAGATPILLPIISDKEAILDQIDLVDGILLSGGYDVHPLFYGEEPHPRLECIYPERDEYEIEVARLASEREKPLLGICRGMQVMNVAFGGTLYQDIPHLVPDSTIQHSQKAKRHVASHSVELIHNTHLHRIFNQDVILTNSFHHQSLKDVAPDFIVNARARDGIIEGIEKQGSSFAIGVQWHPEMMTSQSSSMYKLFEAFASEAARSRLK